MTALWRLTELLELVVIFRTLPLVRRQNPGSGRL